MYVSIGAICCLHYTSEFMDFPEKDKYIGNKYINLIILLLLSEARVALLILFPLIKDLLASENVASFHFFLST